MRDSELRGLILEALYNQGRKDLVNLDQELGALPVPHGATESILRQLVNKGLIVLRQKTRRLFLLNLLTQYGHLGSILAIATIKR